MTKIIVTYQGISFHTTKAAIKRGVGDNESFNEAVRQSYDSLVSFMKTTSIAYGQSGHWNGYNIQLDIIRA